MSSGCCIEPAKDTPTNGIIPTASILIAFQSDMHPLPPRCVCNQRHGVWPPTIAVVNGDHGVSHWARVLENGLRLAEETGANVEVVSRAGMRHDPDSAQIKSILVPTSLNGQVRPGHHCAVQL